MITTASLLPPIRRLRVSWSQRAWIPRISVSGHRSGSRAAFASALPARRSRQNPRTVAPARHRIRCGSVRAHPRFSGCPQSSTKSTKNMSMKHISLPHARSLRGFTLIELLVVISIIAILAGLLLPAISRAKLAALKTTAKTDMKNLGTAISQYEADNSRFPVGPQATGATDLTWGLTNSPLPATAIPSNTDIMVILMDLPILVNTNHIKNPRRQAFFNPKQVNDTISPGLSTIDYQFRDPWGVPYVITLDTDGDGKCTDACYCNAPVSQQTGVTGYNGLVGSTASGPLQFQLNGPIMMWSAGPDKKSSLTTPANTGVNKDNVLGWQ
jgi:prepilin-type N-terminal cleavage/methylation domain-containing protein